MFSGNVCGARAGQATDPITPQTVSRLTVKWKFDASDDISATPAVVGGQVYFGDWGGMFYRLDAASGQVVWSKPVADFIGLGSDAGADGASGDADAGASPFDAAAANATPGLKLSTIPVVRDTPVVTGGLVIAGLINQGTLVAVKADTGDTVWTTTLDPHPYAVVTSSPVLDGNRVYVGIASAEEGASAVDPSYACCSFRGNVAAVDVTTGKVLWQTPMIEDAVFRNAGGSLAGFSGAAVWSTPAVDRNRKLLYVTTGNNYSTPAAYSDGGTPVPAGDHLESILALDLDTGAIRWAQEQVQPLLHPEHRLVVACQADAERESLEVVAAERLDRVGRGEGHAGVVPRASQQLAHVLAALRGFRSLALRHPYPDRSEHSTPPEPSRPRSGGGMRSQNGGVRPFSTRRPSNISKCAGLPVTTVASCTAATAAI
jgi:outer membrane protein assembly factor BamB